jgi:hypothetical protein
MIAAASANITALKSTLTMGYNNMGLADFEGNDTSSSTDISDDAVTSSVMPIYMVNATLPTISLFCSPLVAMYQASLALNQNRLLTRISTPSSNKQ